jgi:uncharacterized membrane protein YgcG
MSLAKAWMMMALRGCSRDSTCARDARLAPSFLSRPPTHQIPDKNNAVTTPRNLIALLPVVVTFPPRMAKTSGFQTERTKAFPVTELDFSRNEITAEGIGAVVQFARTQGSDATAVDLSRNKLNDQAATDEVTRLVKSYSSFAANAFISKLVLSGNAIGRAGATKLIQYAHWERDRFKNDAKPPPPLSLDLSDNCVVDPAALMEDLKGKRIKLCKADAIEDDATVHLAGDFTDQRAPPPPTEKAGKGAASSRGPGGGKGRGGGGSGRDRGGGSGFGRRGGGDRDRGSGRRDDYQRRERDRDRDRRDRERDRDRDRDRDRGRDRRSRSRERRSRSRDRRDRRDDYDRRDRDRRERRSRSRSRDRRRDDDDHDRRGDRDRDRRERRSRSRSRGRRRDDSEEHARDNRHNDEHDKRDENWRRDRKVEEEDHEDDDAVRRAMASDDED